MIEVRIDVNNPWLTTEDLTKLLKVTEATVINLIKAGQIRAFRIGHQYRIPEECLQAFLQSVHTRKQND